MDKRLKELRKALKLTQAEFAERLKVSASNVQSYELGRRKPAASAINLIISEFHVNEAWLLNGEGEMFAPVTREIEIAELATAMFKASDNDFKYKLISVISKLDDDEIETLRKITERLLAEQEKSTEE